MLAGMMENTHSFSLSVGCNVQAVVKILLEQSSMYKAEQSTFFSTLNFYSLMCNEQLVAFRLQTPITARIFL